MSDDTKNGCVADYSMTSHAKVKDMGASQCCLSVVVSVFPHLIGFFLAMQYHSKINTGVHGFVSFAVNIVLFKCSS